MSITPESDLTPSALFARRVRRVLARRKMDPIRLAEITGIDGR